MLCSGWRELPRLGRTCMTTDESTHRYLRIITALVVMLLGAAVPAIAGSPNTEMVPMRDGTLLATDVYVPQGEPPWPVLLIRTPYGRAGSAGVADDYAEVDLAVVVQDVRGRGDSQGRDSVYHGEADGLIQDGYDTFAWIREQPWAHGSIATFGGSALGIVQYLQAVSQPPGLAFMHASAATSNLYDDIYFPGGVFRQKLAAQWLEDQGILWFLEDLAAHPYEDEFWAPVQSRNSYGRVTVPALHIGGWFDIFAQGTLDAFLGYQHSGGPGARGKQKVIMGPWTHAAFHEPRQGELTFPPNARNAPYPVGDALNTMLDHVLQTRWETVPDNPASIPAVQYYIMGDVDDPEAPGNRWRAAADWPPPAARVRFHLQSGGGLSEDCPTSRKSRTKWRYDPAEPVTTLCGSNLYLQAGPCDHRSLEARDDVVVFSSEVLTEPLEITGRIKAHLLVSIDRTDTDLMVWLSDVYPDGRSMLITDGALRLASRGSSSGLTPLQPGETVTAEVDLLSTSIVLNKGHRLRIAVSSSNSPRFLANKNNGLPFGAMQKGPILPVNVTLFHQQGQSSYIELPLPERAAGDVQECPSTEPVASGSGRHWLLAVAILVLAVAGVWLLRRRMGVGRRTPTGAPRPPSTALLLACLAVLAAGCTGSLQHDGDDSPPDDDDDSAALGDHDDSAAGDITFPLDGFGELSGDCDFLDKDNLDDPEPVLYANQLDLHSKDFDAKLLSEGGQEVINDGNLGGSSLHSEAFAYEVLYRCELAELVKTEGEIDYQDPAGKKTDLLVQIEGHRLGVSVTRAYGWPPEAPYTEAQATELLGDKLSDVLLSSANVANSDRWSRQILSILAYAPEHGQRIEAAWTSLDPAVRANTIVVVTVTEGNDDYIY